MDLVDVMQQVPGILHALPHDTQKAVQASCRQLRTLVHNNASTILFRQAPPHTPATEVVLLVKGGWRQLKILSFRKAGLEPEAMAVLSHGHWPLLQCLNLACNNIGERGMKSFSLCPWPALEVLQLNEVGMSAQMVIHLTRANLPHLTSLNLSYNNMEACINILTEGRWPQLGTLELSWSNLSSACLAQLVRGAWPNLKRLDLSNNNMLIASIGDFRNAAWPLLANLNLQGGVHGGLFMKASQTQEQAFVSFAQCEWRYLQNLNLSSCNLQPAIMRKLCQAQWQNLSFLDFTANCLHSDSLKYLVASQWSQLRCLSMKWCDIDITAVSHLIQAQWPCLEFLGLGGNDINVEALEVLMQAKWPMLKFLDLSRNYLGPARIVRLSTGTLLLKDGGDKNVIDPPAWLLKQWPRLQEIDLSCCNIPF